MPRAREGTPSPCAAAPPISRSRSLTRRDIARVVITHPHVDHYGLAGRVVAESDWVIDMGPGAGDEGGRIVVAGTPAAVARSKKSRTAPYLRAFMGG